MLALREHYRDGGLFAWSARPQRIERMAGRYLGFVYDRLFAYPGVLTLIAVRLVAAAMIPLVAQDPRVFRVAVSAVALTSLLHGIRGWDGRHGSEHMTTLTFGSMALALLSGSPVVWRAELWFLTLQLCLAYLTTGLLKAPEPGWWDGAWLRDLLRTRMYGHRALWDFARRHPAARAAASIAVVSFECSFVLTLLLPLEYAWPWLAAGVLFHAANAIVVGVHTFVWAYVALYPALIYCRS